MPISGTTALAIYDQMRTAASDVEFRLHGPDHILELGKEGDWHEATEEEVDSILNPGTSQDTEESSELSNDPLSETGTNAPVDPEDVVASMLDPRDGSTYPKTRKEDESDVYDV